MGNKQIIQLIVMVMYLLFNIGYVSANNSDASSSSRANDLTEYPVEGHWPYGPTNTSEIWTDGNTNLLIYGEGTVLRIADVTDPSNITVISEVRTNYPVWHIDVVADGSMVAVSDRGKWVTLIDIQNNNSPFILDRYEVENGRRPYGLSFVNNNLLVVAVTPAGLWALDISDPTNMALAGTYIEPGTDFVFDVEVLGDYAFLADDVEGVSAIDISNLNSMSLSTRFSSANLASHISIYGNTAYVSRRGFGISVLDLDVSQSPVVISDLGTINTNQFPAGFGIAYRAELAGNGLLAVADGIQGNGVVLMDITNPNSPIVFGGTTAPIFGLSVLGDHAFASRFNWYTNHGIYAFDLDIQSRGAQEPPGEVDYLPLITSAVDVDVTDNFVTVSTDNSGMVLIDVSSPSQPVTSAWIKTNGVKSAVKVNDVVAMVTVDKFLHLVDVSDVANPVMLPSFDLGNGNSAWHVVQTITSEVVISTGSQGVKWVDLTDPLIPVITSTWTEQTNANIIKVVQSNDLVVAFSGANAWVIDFSDKQSPQLMDTFTLSRSIRDADIDGDFLYLANEIDGLRIWDISAPANVQEVADFSVLPTSANGVKVRNNIAYIAADTFYGLVRVDVSTPQSPQFIAVTTTPGKAVKIDATDNILALADSDSGVRIWATQSETPIFANGFEAL